MKDNLWDHLIRWANRHGMSVQFVMEFLVTAGLLTVLLWTGLLRRLGVGYEGPYPVSSDPLVLLLVNVLGILAIFIVLGLFHDVIPHDLPERARRWLRRRDGDRGY